MQPIAEPKNNTANVHECVVAMSFTDGAPAIVTARVGNGQLTLFAFSVESPHDTEQASSNVWTAWPLSPSFPPVIHQIVNQSLQHEQDRRNVTIGEPVLTTRGIHSSDSMLWIRHQQSSTQQVLPKDDSTNSAFANARLSGFYRTSPTPESRSNEVVAVNVDTRESNPQSVPLSDIADRFPVITDLENFVPNRQRADSMNDTTYRYVMFIVLSLLLAESLLAWFFGRTS
jgi:hypothetical protein